MIHSNNVYVFIMRFITCWTTLHYALNTDNTQLNTDSRHKLLSTLTLKQRMRNFLLELRSNTSQIWSVDTESYCCIYSLYSVAIIRLFLLFKIYTTFYRQSNIYPWYTRIYILYLSLSNAEYPKPSFNFNIGTRSMLK